MSLSCLLAATDTRGQWHLGIGDPTPMGWFIAFAYLATCIVCGVVWVAERRASRQGRAASPRFWCVLTAALLVLGLNKQLDLQTLLNDIGRRMAMTEGWYSRRRIYQALFIGVVATAGLSAVGGVSWLAHRQWKKNILALVGTVFLYVFVLIRASSFHHVDAMLGWRFLGWKWNWVLELGGIVVVALGALRAWNHGRRNHGETQSAHDSRGARSYTFKHGVIVPRGDENPRSSDRRG